MAQIAGSNAVARWASRCALAACVYAAGTIGCSSDAQPGSGDPSGGDTSSDAGGDGLGGNDGLGGTGNATGDAGSNTGEGGSNGSDLAPGDWDSSNWDQAVWQ